MNPFDLAILRFLTGLANGSVTFDAAVAALTGLELAKGGVVMALYWWAWFDARSDARRREVLISTLFAAAVATTAASLLATALPFRLRPNLQYRTPGQLVAPGWDDWSAFPSDHATLFFALAAGLYRALPWAGRAALLHALFVVCLPRLYVGLHYPTDVLGGAVLGVASALLFTSARLRSAIARLPLAFARRSPGPFHAAFFLLSYLVATLFSDLRRVGTALVGWWTH